MTQEQLASAAGIGRSFVNQLEQGHFSATLETLGTLASALEISAETLILSDCDGRAHRNTKSLRLSEPDDVPRAFSAASCPDSGLLDREAAPSQPSGEGGIGSG